MTPDDQLAFLRLLEAEIRMQADELSRSLDLIVERIALLTQQSTRLISVPWVSQLGADADYAPGDCGAACVTMLVKWFGHETTVDEVSRQTGKTKGYLFLDFNDLTRAAAAFGLSLEYRSALLQAHFRSQLDKGRPIIALVNYQSLPPELRREANYNAGHWIVIVGYDETHLIYHDPDWPDVEHGANVRILEADFRRAFETKAPGNKNAQHALVLR